MKVIFHFSTPSIPLEVGGIIVMDQHPISYSPYCSHQIGYKPRWGAHKRRVCGQLSSGAFRFLFCLSFPGAFFVGILGSGSVTFTFHYPLSISLSHFNFYYPVSISLSTITFHILRITVTCVCFVGILGSAGATFHFQFHFHFSYSQNYCHWCVLCWYSGLRQCTPLIGKCTTYLTISL